MASSAPALSSLFSVEEPARSHPPVSPAQLQAALAVAVSRIPPLFPLRHFVAVNPFLGFVHQPFAEACATLQRCVGAAPLQAPDEYRRAWAAGHITAADLAAVGNEVWTPAKLTQALACAGSETLPGPLPTVADWLDQSRPRAHWSALVVDEISKWCGVTFDENQTTWNSPWKTTGLYCGWREAAQHDRNPEAFGLTGFRKFVAALPADPAEAIAACLQKISPPPAELADFLHRQLVTIAGWAGYLQYLVREDALRGRPNSALQELLAVRLAYDAALLEAFGPDTPDRPEWRRPHLMWTADRYEALARWQHAYEHGYQQRLGLALAAQPSVAPVGRPRVQAVFCIDVRSEVFRRHLEATVPGVQTIGFAGFFGFSVAHESADGAAAARCPVLLVPSVDTCEPLSPAQATKEATARTERRAWNAFQNSAASCFSFVESVGLAFGTALGSAGKSSGPQCSRVAPAFKSASLATRAALAAGALRNMGLVRNFARLVLICGHGSQTANNPYASGLDCGACGGHAGDTNARLAALTLNDPDVRALLAREGLVIPEDTCFIAGLHNTTTDEIALFGGDSLPREHQGDVANLRQWLALAGSAARRERAPALGLANLAEDALRPAVLARAVDIAEVRPEWGLANNAALIAAPRSRTAQLKLGGRVFLHDYDAAADPEDKVLTLILCAPVVVASWINLQYYASRIDPRHYGAGNKVLHNVVGGIGVLEGNSGDLKVGLPVQSLHDGETFVHEPRRLAVYLDAPRSRISAVLAANPSVQGLFDHGWLHLWALEGQNCYRYARGTWLPGK